MASVSQNSFMSSTSQGNQSTYSSRFNLIESTVYHKIINLKAQKLELLSHLSAQIDLRYQAENELMGLLRAVKK